MDQETKQSWNTLGKLLGVILVETQKQTAEMQKQTAILSQLLVKQEDRGDSLKVWKG